MSNQIISVSRKINPQDSRCRYWAKVVRATDTIPLPSHVDGANDIPGAYLRAGGEEELFPGDYLLEGEARHPAKQRGWAYWAWVGVFDGANAGKSCDAYDGPAWAKDVIKRAVALDLMTAERAKELLPGAGDCSALIRLIHVRRHFADLGAMTKPAIDRMLAEKTEALSSSSDGSI